VRNDRLGLWVAFAVAVCIVAMALALAACVVALLLRFGGLI
jgi:hypothetical protein